MKEEPSTPEEAADAKTQSWEGKVLTWGNEMPSSQMQFMMRDVTWNEVGYVGGEGGAQCLESYGRELELYFKYRKSNWIQFYF